MFELGLNTQTFIFILNIGIPVIYFVNFFFMVYKLKGMDKDAPFYTFIKSLVYFFFFYGLGALWFVWYDFFYMDLTSPNPINILFGTDPAPPELSMHLWQIGNMIQNIGLFLMILQLRKRVFQKKFYQKLPIIWEIIGIGIMFFIFLNFFLALGIPIPLISEVPYFWMEMNFLFNFTWSISLPLTYSIIYRNAAGSMKKFAGILFFCFILYGISWGLRSRAAVYMIGAMFSWLPLLGVPNPFTFEVLWFIRGFSIVLNLGLVFYAYKKLLAEF